MCIPIVQWSLLMYKVVSNGANRKKAFACVYVCVHVCRPWRDLDAYGPHVYMYVHVCMYVRACVGACVCVHVCVHVSVCQCYSRSLKSWGGLFLR